MSGSNSHRRAIGPASHADSVERCFHLPAALQSAGQAAEAVIEYEQVLAAAPEMAAAANNLGWILACHSDPALRDPAKARQLAELACQKTEYQEAAYLDTLAVAAAASGDFESAVQRATAAVKLYEAEGSGAVRGARARLRGYREGQAYIAPAS